jgi:lipopolysaccharide/colanic/teichoic acid biosynthesis glycosyltransferase
MKTPNTTARNKRWYECWGKRALDLVASILLVILFCPLFLVTTILIVCTSRGPILFRQQRVGKEGIPFTMFKFRTMKRVASEDSITRHARDLASRGVLFKIDSDPRITRVGMLLRRLSLDELPQFFNVIKGEMSLVGPRPLILFMVAPYPEENRQRNAIVPGLTGLWQISARGESSSVLQMIEYDVAYRKKLSFHYDLRILAKTIPIVIRGTGVK